MRQIPPELMRYELEETKNFKVKVPSFFLIYFKGIIEFAAPNAEIYRFDSRMKMNLMDENYISLTERQMLLQATHLKNTEWVYGVVVYTGRSH